MFRDCRKIVQFLWPMQLSVIRLDWIINDLKMESVWIFIAFGILTLASKLELGEGRKGAKDDFVRVEVPAWVQEGETALLHCLYDVSKENLYSMKWYKGSQEFYRFTPKESPPIRVFKTTFGGVVDLSLSNSSVVALTRVSLNMTDRYTCEVTKDFPDYTTSMRAGKMTVVALPHHKPVIMTSRKSVSVGDTLAVNCTSSRSNPVAKITFLLNSFPVAKHYLTPEIIHHDFGEDDNKESISSGLQFTVRQQDFIKSRVTITCQASIEPDLYSSSTDIIVLEDNTPKISSVVENNSYFGKSDNHIASSSSIGCPPSTILFAVALTVFFTHGWLPPIVFHLNISI